MTSRVVDREHYARATKYNRSILEAMAAQPGQMGVTARLGLATIGTDEWTADEIERGTTDAEIVIATIERAASLVIARIVGLGPVGQEACIAAVASTIRRGLGQFEAMSADQLDAALVKTHPRQ